MSAKKSLIWSKTLQSGLDMEPILNIFLKTATKMFIARMNDKQPNAKLQAI